MNGANENVPELVKGIDLGTSHMGAVFCKIFVRTAFKDLPRFKIMKEIYANTSLASTKFHQIH